MQVAILMGQPTITQPDPTDTPKLIADNITNNWVGLKPPSNNYFTGALGISGTLNLTANGTEVSWNAIDSDIGTVDENLHQLRVWAKGKKKEIAFDVSQGTIKGTCHESPFHVRYLVHGKKLFVGFWID